ncbi:MAG TPA: hypothetical protein VNF68_12020, partial [Candidatus Baltobacteraceae bacterium]|nr:hypothetical protein [Candidatus Baltobacteraceae bacterium]
MLAALDPRNTPSTLAVTDDGAVWFRETFTWHPRIARFGAHGTFREFRDPYAGEPQYDPCYQPQSCFPVGGEDGFSPLVADGDRVLIGPLRRNPTSVSVLSADGTITTRSAVGCLAAGPNIACFRNAKIGAPFSGRFTPSSLS